MDKMIERMPPPPQEDAVNLRFIKAHGLGLDNVVKAIEKAGHDFVRGIAVEVRSAEGLTAGYLIYIPFNVQKNVEQFFESNREENY